MSLNKTSAGGERRGIGLFNEQAIGLMANRVLIRRGVEPCGGAGLANQNRSFGQRSSNGYRMWILPAQETECEERSPVPNGLWMKPERR